MTEEYQDLDEWNTKINTLPQIMNKFYKSERIGKNNQGSLRMFFWAAVYRHYRWHLREVKNILTLWGDDE